MPVPALPAEELEPSAAWQAALESYARELTTRGAAAATLRAYRRDLLELGAWATARGREPGELEYRDLRSYAAALSERRLARTSVGRKLAAARGLHAHLLATGQAVSNPADLLPTPKRDSRLPRVLGRDEVASLLERIPATGPLEVRDRALFELAYSCGLRADEIVSLDLGALDFESETVRVTGKGAKTRVVPDRRAGPAGPAQLPRPRPPRARAARRRAGAVRLASRSPPGDLPTCAGDWRSGSARRRWRDGSHRTPCATRSPPICSRAAPICARSRSCSGTRACPTTQVYTRVEPSRLASEYAKAHPRA